MMETLLPNPLTGDEMSDMDDEEVIYELFKSVTKEDIDLDYIMVRADHSVISKWVHAAHLYKICMIDLK